MELFGRQMDDRELRRHVGDLSQIADAREGVLTAGRADGVRVVDVKTGGGLEFSVLPSRGMDIAWASYKGIPLSFVSKAGVVHPSYFEKDQGSFLRSFTCGLLTTCGLTYMGAPCVDEGEALGLHGRISNIPAHDVSIRKEWRQGIYCIEVRGQVRESRMFGENVTLNRTYQTTLGSNTIHVHDVVENEGFQVEPFMLLYHINLGYPLVSADAELFHSNASVAARDAEAQSGIASYRRFQEPAPGYEEQVFYLDFHRKGPVQCALYNKALGLGVQLRFDTRQFSHFGEWKMMGEGDYVVGLEPCTWKPEGRAKARETGELEFLQPGEKRTFDFDILVIESPESILDSQD